MGYYNEIKLVTTKKGWEAVKEELKRSPAWEKSDLDEHAEPLCDGKFVLAEFLDVKWSNGAELIEKALDKLEGEHLPYRFIRVGEDYDDNEYIANYEEGDWGMPELVLERTIKVEY